MRERMESSRSSISGVWQRLKWLPAFGVPAGMTLMLLFDGEISRSPQGPDTITSISVSGTVSPGERGESASPEAHPRGRIERETRTDVRVVFADSFQEAAPSDPISPPSQGQNASRSRSEGGLEPGRHAPRPSANSEYDSRSSEKDAHDESQEEASESLQEAVDRYLRDVEQRLNDRINRLLALYQVTQDDQALAQSSPGSIRHLISRSESPVLNLHPFSYSGDFTADYRYTQDQQAAVQRIQVLDARLLRLVGHAVDSRDFSHVLSIVTGDRSRVEAYRVLLSGQQAAFILRCREAHYQLQQRTVDGTQIAAVYVALYPLFTSATQSPDMLAVLDRTVNLLTDTASQVQNRENAVREVYAFLQRLVTRQTTQQAGRATQQIIPDERLSVLFERVRAVHHQQEVQTARADIEQMFSRISHDPSTRYEQVLSDPTLMFLTYKLRIIRDSGDARSYDAEYQRCVRLLSDMIGFYDGQENRAQDVSNLRSRLKEISDDRQNG